MAALTIRFDRTATAAVVAAPQLDLPVRFAKLDLTDREQDRRALTFLWGLLASMTLQTVWRCDARPGVPVVVDSDFTCDNGGSGLDGGLMLSVQLDEVGVFVASINSLRELQCGTSPTLLGLLEALEAHINDHLRRLTALLAPSPSVTLAR